MNGKNWILFLVLLGHVLSGSALSVEPHEMLSDPMLEKRARDLSQQLRCLQCQNETIDTSNAEVARDLRRYVREQIMAGKTDEQIVTFLVEKYGPFIRMEPPVQSKTLPLWYGPYLILFLGLLGGGYYISRRSGSAQSQNGSLTDEEQEEIKRLLSK